MAENYTEALVSHQNISKNDWDNNKNWLTPLKRILVKRWNNFKIYIIDI